MKYTDLMEPKDISMAHCWTVFAGMVLSGVSDVQRTEMRKAFYAGFSEGFKIFEDLSQLPEADAVAHLSRLQGEMRDFVGRMMGEP